MSPRLLHYRTRMTMSPLFQMMKLRPCAYKAPKDTRPVLPRGRGTDCGPGRPLPVIGASPSVPSHLEETRSNTPELQDSHQRPNRILSGLRPNTGLDTLCAGNLMAPAALSRPCGGPACGVRAAPPQQAAPLLWGPAHRGRLADPRGPCFAELTLL